MEGNDHKLPRCTKMRSIGIPRLPAGMFACILIFTIGALCYSEQKTATHKTNRSSKSPAGQQIFAANCSGCHGLDGTGSQRAPNIVNNPQVTKLSAEELHGIISRGVPGTGMPAFQYLGNSAISSLTSYVRSLQGRGRESAVSGDPAHGEKLFFVSAQCANSHMIAGKGGFIGPDLSNYAQTHSGDKVKFA